MTQGLSNNLRTHILELTKDREIRITEEQYKSIKASQAIDKWNDPLLIRDPDTKKVIHDGLMKDILGFHEIELQKVQYGGFRCDYGNSHGLRQSCECQKKYNIVPGVFTDKCVELFGKLPGFLTRAQIDKVHLAFRSSH